MKAKVNGNKIKVAPYPKLMISEIGNIVLFERYETGTVIVSGVDRYEVGHHSSSWDMGCFKDFEGSVTLSND